LLDRRGSGHLSEVEFQRTLLQEFPGEVVMEDAWYGPHLAFPKSCSVIYALGWVRKDGLLYNDKAVRGDGSLFDIEPQRRWYAETAG